MIAGVMVVGAIPAAAAVTIGPASLPNGTAGVAYSQVLTPAGGTAPYTYSVSSGTLPDGLLLSPGPSNTATLSGTPTEAGSFAFVVQATDTTATPGQVSYNLTVAPPTIVVAPTTLPAGTKATAYSQAITATGGTSPYQFSLATGALPPGITLSSGGLLSGTPTTTGTSSFSVSAADDTAGPGAPYSVSKSYTLTINGAPLAPTDVSATAGDQQATVTFTAPTGLVDTYTVSSNPVTTPTTCAAPATSCIKTGLTNGTQYTFTVKATNSAGDSPLSVASNTVRPGGTVNTIAFTAIPNPQTFGSTLTLAATATAGSVTFSSATPTICSVANANQVTYLALGTCTINADQAGDATNLPNNHRSARQSQSFAVNAATPTVTVTSSVNPSVFGQPLTFTATLTAPVTTTGTVTWTVNGVAGVGTASALSATGTATFVPTTPLAVGSDAVKASYAPLGTDPNHLAATSNTLSQVVGKANTTTTVQVIGNQLSATVAPVAPGAGAPTGTVTFTVGGQPAGSASLVSGVATVTGVNVGSQAVAATYAGDANFLASSGNRTAIGPTVVPHVTSAHAKHRGWYRSPVHVSFTCTANTAPLSAPCPGTVTKSRNGAAQSVTRTVTQTDGGTTTVTVSPINIDGTAPKLKVKEKGRQVTCHASDSLSHGASCKVTRTSSTKNGVKTVHWTATAHDRAGNTKTQHGHFSFTV